MVASPPEDLDNNTQEDLQGDQPEWHLSCCCESASTVSILLHCLIQVSSESADSKLGDSSYTQSRSRSSAAHSKMQPVTVFCGPNNLTFHANGRAKQSQASVDIQRSMFSEYQVCDESGQNEDCQAGGGFCVNLTDVLDCMHVLGTHSLDRTKLCFTYSSRTEIFKLELLEESGVLSTAAIPGMMCPEDDLASPLALTFRSFPIAARIIVKSTILRESISELESVPGASCGTVALGPNSLEFAAVGHLGECLIFIPAKGSHVVSLDVRREAARTYPLHSLLGSMKGLEIAEETCISINEQGMMAIQHQMIDPVGDGNENPNYVDFIMTCLDDEDESTVHNQTQTQTQSEASVGWRQSQDSTDAVSATNSPTNPTAEDESDHEDNTAISAISSTSLFGSVVRDENTATTSKRAKKAFRRPRHSVPESEDDSDMSRNLLDEDNEEDEPLDVTLSALGRHRREENRCDSPELVYGDQ